MTAPGIGTAAGRPAGTAFAESLRAHRGPLLLTYALFNLENLLGLLAPLALGLAINGLLSGSPSGLALFALQAAAQTAVTAGRQAYDTRTFARMHAELASRLVVAQRGGRVDVSSVAARSGLSRELVDFLERDAVVVMSSAYALIGAAAMLAGYDPAFLVASAVATAASCLQTAAFGRFAFGLNRRINDELEREVAVIERGRPGEVVGHFDRLARLRVRLSDGRALHYAATEVSMLALMAFALHRLCGPDEAADPGRVYAVYRYILMLAAGLGNLPDLAQQAGRVRDIARRLRMGPGGLAGPGEEDRP